MSKKLYIVSIVLMILIGIFLIGVLVIGINRGHSFIGSFKVDKTEENICKQEEYALTDIEELNLDFISSNLNIILTDDDNLKVIQYSNDNLDSDKLFRVDNSNGKIRINEDYYKNFVFNWGFNNYSAYDIYLPKNYNKKIIIKNVSGEVIVNGDLNLEQLQVTSTSGRITLNNVIVINDFISKSISGSINIGSIEAKNSNIQTTSGSISITSLNNSNYIRSISGSVEVDNIIGNSDIETTSGRIRINSFEIKDDSHLKSISGSVKVNITDASNSELRINTVSGHISVPNGSYIVGNAPYIPLSINTVSGSVTITVDEDL